MFSRVAIIAWVFLTVSVNSLPFSSRPWARQIDATDPNVNLAAGNPTVPNSPSAADPNAVSTPNFSGPPALDFDPDIVPKFNFNGPPAADPNASPPIDPSIIDPPADPNPAPNPAPPIDPNSGPSVDPNVA